MSVDSVSRIAYYIRLVYNRLDLPWKITRQRATNHRALLRKINYEDKASYAFLPPWADLKKGNRADLENELREYSSYVR